MKGEMGMNIRQIMDRFVEKKSCKAYRKRMTTWEYPLHSHYVFRHSVYGDGPVAEFNYHYHSIITYYSELSKEIEKYEEAYCFFIEKAIANKYRVLINSAYGQKELFTFASDNTQLAEIAKIGFDSGVLNIVDQNGCRVVPPRAPKGKYDARYNRVHIKQRMAFAAEDILYGLQTDREFNIKRHEQLCKDYAMLCQHINPDAARFCDAFHLDVNEMYNMC